ncbi:RHS repeat-associated protein [Micromonospora sp. A200]|uniref:golvesin C-terminal-like domain-containing protein n=1 Tax=Micromonospora sp. A200 TaxID=2940568 RepID=UPI002473FB00|nr:DNRLRE domain-containing protein [Micromonospora sp. A200]MDH6462647.1 RHS repeat-associated protein [Micromonospora sp. A200]
MKRRSRGPLVGGLVLALVATVGWMEVPDDQRGGAVPVAKAEEDDGFFSKLDNAARDLVDGGPRKARPEVVGAGLTVSEQPPPAKNWPAQKRVKELTGKRTANTKVYQLSDGRTQAEISAVPLHYRDAKGKFQPIDTKVRPATEKGYVQGNRTNTFTSLFGDSSKELARFEKDGRSIELGLAGAAKAVTPKVSGSTVTYPGLAGGADVVYDVTSTALKEKIVLHRAPTGPVSYTFTLDTAGLTAQQRADGSIAFVRPGGGEPAFVMPAPFMYDAKDDKSSPHGKVWSDKVTQRVQQMYGQTSVTLSADAGWLADPARVYPVVIDPTIKVQPVPTDAQDVQIYSGATTTNYNDTYQLKVGTTDTQAWRSLLKFNLDSIPANTPISDAQLQLYYSQTHTTYAADVPMQAHRVTADWTEGSATWGTMSTKFAGAPAANVVTKDDGDSGTSVTGSWPYSGNTTLTPKAVNSDYRFHGSSLATDTHTWVPTITESGDYQVEVHYVAASDRPTNAPYTVHFSGGSKRYEVNQTTPDSQGKWVTLGTHPFVAGTTGKVVLNGVPGTSANADAVRFTKAGAVKKYAQSSVWNSFPVRNLVQEWVNGTSNYGFMVKALDEATKGKGGPVYEASEYAYNNDRRDFNLPKLVVTYGRPGVTVNPPTTITSTGAVLDWPGYVDPSTAIGDNIVEYQVHRSVHQNFEPSATTLISPVSSATRSYQDTTAVPTAADNTDPMARKFYYYMVAVKTQDGQVIAGPTQQAMLPKAGQITRIYRSAATDATGSNGVIDTTLSAARPTENVDSYDGDPYVSPGNNSSWFGDTRGLIKFPALAGIPTDAQIVDADLRMYNNALYPGTDTDEYVDVYKLKRAFNETKATWNSYDGVNAWTTAGGDYDTAWKASFNGFTNDPEWENWDVTTAVKGWHTTPTTNYGLLLRQRDEVNQTARAMLLSAEGAEPLLRPTLEVTYLEQTAESTYYAASTPQTLTPNATYTLPVTVSNPTLAPWNTTDWELTYDWKRLNETGALVDATDESYELRTPLPKNVLAGATVDVTAQVKTPPSSTDGNKRTEYVLNWDLRKKLDGSKLSASSPIKGLPQNVAVEEPTSDQLGLEKFYSYAGKNTGAGGTLMNNLYAGNTVWSYNAINNPSRGLSTFVRMSYNSLDTTDSVAGFGWSLQASSMMRLGTPLDFHPNPNPTKVTLTDGDGTSHWFTWDAATSEWKSPKGVNLYLQKYSTVDCKPNVQERKAWVLTKPDRTQFFYDCEGFLSSTVDNNGNEMLFTYEERKSNNKPTKFLKYITDPTGRITLTLDYYAKGQTYDYINDTTWARVSGATNLTNPKIIDHVSQITDISGRKLTFTYTDKGLLGELIDGAGSTNGTPKTFKFRYDMTQGNKNVKLVKVTDPRASATGQAYSTDLVYNYPQAGDDPKWHWRTKSYTDRLGHPTTFGYVDPDATNNIQTTVTDAENHATTYLMDGYGRSIQTTNAKNEVTKLGWDDDHNVTRLEEANTAVSTWEYDTKTGYPTVVKDAEAVRNGWPGTVLTYQRQLNGYVAEVLTKTSSEGRKWSFAYTAEGDIESVTDPLGNTTATVGDYTSTNTYDEWGQLLTAKDARGNITQYGPFHVSGYPTTIKDAGDGLSYFTYDARGNVTEVKNGKNAKVTQAYDTFGRPTTKVEPVDAANGRYITTTAPEYDQNDNITKAYAANGTASTSVYDRADQVLETLAPKDEATDPERKTTTTYDKVGNVLTVTEPQGNLTATVGDFTTTTKYDVIYQPIEVTNGLGQKVSSEYDNVGNVKVLYDAKKNASAADDFTTKFDYDWNHRVVKTTDALGKFTTARYDKDGLTVGSTDADANESLAKYDARGALVESKVPHSKDGAGTITYRTTKYEYDQVGNQTKVISPRGVNTDDAVDADDFATQKVYDKLNRVAEEWSAYDKDDSRYNTPNKTIYTYDSVGNLEKVSAPPSDGQTVRNDTTYTYYDNGWTKTTADPWDITTSYDYNDLGQQIKTTLTSAGGSQSRTMTWDYFPSGNQRGRSEDGLPVGKDVVLVDNSDTHNTATQGTWTSGAAQGNYGYDVATAPAGSGTAQFNWQLNIPQGGNYDVFVRYPQVSGAATDAKFTITYSGGASVTRTVNQTQGAGTWINLGKYAFVEDGVQKVTLTDQATGKVVADAVKLVRDNATDVDNEKKEFTYKYNPNGMMVEVKDLSPGAQINRYEIGYDDLNQIDSVKEFVGTATTPKNTTSLTYDPNGNPLTSTHDLTWSKIEYDERDMVAKVTNADSATAGNQQISTFTYTARGQMLKQAKPNGNTVDFEYYLDGATKRQLEKTSGGATVAEHNLEYSANGHPSRDVMKLMNADNSADHIDNTYVFSYDPQDRISRLDKTGDSSSVESYTYDANSNTVAQTIEGATSTSKYDRNRLHSTTSGGVTSTYNYDPLGRLDTVSMGGQRAQKYYYDGFDRTAKTTAGIGATAKSTTYVYDPFDRTVSQTTGSKTTAFTYLGMDNQVLREEVEGKATKSYQYAPWGQQLTQIKHKDDGSREYSQFIYRPRGDVVGITKEDGKTRATYGYTAYGKDDESQFTGVDKPGAQAEGEEPYNAFRFNASRWDVGSGTYDMGFRNYDPGLNRFLTRDSYGGAMADMGLATDPFTGNRYAFAGGNPVSFVELDGHLFGMSWSDVGHAALDVAGMVPVIGEVADVANGIWYLAEGNYVDAAMSMASAIPLAGNAVAAAKLAKTGKKIADGIDTTNDTRKAAKAGEPSTGTPKSGPSCKVNSFVPGTKVLMADGSTKAIEDLREGDWIKATDVETGDTRDRQVTDTRNNKGDKKLVTLTIDLDGQNGDATGKVTSTGGHHYWLPDVGRWVTADTLKPGMWLRTSSGVWVQISLVDHERRHERVFNLTVDADHNYYVLAGGQTILVHNECPEQIDLNSDELSKKAFETRQKAGLWDGDRNVAVARVKGPEGERLVAGVSKRKDYHSEDSIMDQLKDGEMIHELYSERLPCPDRCGPMLAGSDRMASDARITYTVPYYSEKAKGGRALNRGARELLVSLLQRERARLQ